MLRSASRSVHLILHIIVLALPSRMHMAPKQRNRVSGQSCSIPIVPPPEVVDSMKSAFGWMPFCLKRVATALVDADCELSDEALARTIHFALYCVSINSYICCGFSAGSGMNKLCPLVSLVSHLLRWQEHISACISSG